MIPMMTPAVVVPPGRILERELEARGWSQRDLAAIMNRPPQAISEIVRGSKQIIPETALGLAQALGTSPELWMNLESNYRLHVARQPAQDAEIARRGRLYDLAPIGELIKRGWIQRSDSLDVLEKRVCGFLEINSLGNEPQLAVNFRSTQEHGPEKSAQIAWVKRVEHLAKAQHVPEFNRGALKKGIPETLVLSRKAEDVAKVPSVLQKLGIRFVIVRHLPRTYIDGAALLSGGRPVIALSLRFDRIDAFWFTLMHELAHIYAGHRDPHLDQLYDTDLATDATEKEANELARNWLVDAREFKVFVKTSKPYFSRSRVLDFALGQNRHPGIVVGRLHHDGIIDYKNLNSYLVRVSPFLSGWIDR
jgi:HTH-type transcriptional regulator/antitoxin HigA